MLTVAITQNWSYERNESVGAAIHVEALTKEFGSVKAVDGLTFDVERGGVVGLLGPNGAGKSTTIRMLLGLIKPSSGSASILGHSIEHPAGYIEQVGALIETPAFYPKLTGEANLRTLAVLDGQPRTRIDEVLEIVGLTGREGDRLGEYSLGMKQRLGIASALLRDPDLLILDEPTNGLDPAGIVEIRELLKQLAAEGRTVFVSSHLLAEIQAMVDRVVIVNKGTLVFEGGLVGLLEEASQEVVAVPEHGEDLGRLGEVFTNAGYAATVSDVAVCVQGAVEAPGELNRIAFSNGVTLAELRVNAEDLEDVFLRMTNGTVGL
jgi:ABC-2 type transport system ATP-binding protein